MTAHQIMRRLAFSHFDRRTNLCIPRCCFAGWEADLLVLRPSNWMEEVEIKISVSDFRREFTTKVDKHQMLTLGSRRLVYGPELEAVRNHPSFTFRRGDGFGYVRDNPHKLRRFWFAMPKDLAAKLEPEIPEHAGLLSVDDGRFVDIKVVKPAPVLKYGRKLTDAERMELLRLAYFRFWDVEDREFKAAIAAEEVA